MNVDFRRDVSSMEQESKFEDGAQTPRRDSESVKKAKDIGGILQDVGPNSAQPSSVELSSRVNYGSRQIPVQSDDGGPSQGELEARHLENLIGLPELPDCEFLDCSGSTLLTVLPPLPACNFFSLERGPLG